MTPTIDQKDSTRSADHHIPIEEIELDICICETLRQDDISSAIERISRVTDDEMSSSFSASDEYNLLSESGHMEDLVEWEGYSFSFWILRSERT